MPLLLRLKCNCQLHIIILFRLVAARSALRLPVLGAIAAATAAAGAPASRDCEEDSLEESLVLLTFFSLSFARLDRLAEEEELLAKSEVLAPLGLDPLIEREWREGRAPSGFDEFLVSVGLSLACDELGSALCRLVLLAVFERSVRGRDIGGASSEPVKSKIARLSFSFSMLPSSCLVDRDFVTLERVWLAVLVDVVSCVVAAT